MPDTPIDQSAGIQSIRLKVPTGTVPIPPAGFGQLHSPGPGLLALRLPDGSVVPIGGGGGSATALENERGVVTVEQVGVEPQAITIYPKPESNGQIKLAGSVIDATNQPQAPDAMTLRQRDDPPVEPLAGRLVYWLDSTGNLRCLRPGPIDGISLSAGSGQSVAVDAGGAGLLGGSGGTVYANGNVARLDSSDGSVILDGDSLDLTPPAGRLVVSGLPTVDPGVAGALWIAPITRQLMVSAG